MMRSISLFGLAVVAIITSLPAEACRCPIYDTEEMARTAFQEADLVFMGTAVSTSPALVPDERGEALSTTQFSLNRVFVGNGDGAVDIIHRGMRNRNLCGPYFDDGSSYLVLAYEEDGLLVTTVCNSYSEDYITDAMHTVLNAIVTSEE